MTSHPERQELCPSPNCLDYLESLPLCPTCWGELPIYWQSEIRRAQREVDQAPPGPGRIEAKVALAGVVERAVSGEAA